MKKVNPYGYATNEYWQFEAEQHGYKNAQDWLRAEDKTSTAEPPEDWDNTETYEEGY